MVHSQNVAVQINWYESVALKCWQLKYFEDLDYSMYFIFHYAIASKNRFRDIWVKLFWVPLPLLVAE